MNKFVKRFQRLQAAADRAFAEMLLDAKDRATHLTIRPGEIRMKEWRQREAKLLGASENAVAMRLSRGQYPDLKIRRVNARVVYVTDERPR